MLPMLTIYEKLECMKNNGLLAPINSNDRSFDYPIIYKDTTHNAILFTDISRMLATTKLICQLGDHI